LLSAEELRAVVAYVRAPRPHAHARTASLHLLEAKRGVALVQLESREPPRSNRISSCRSERSALQARSGSLGAPVRALGAEFLARPPFYEAHLRLHPSSLLPTDVMTRSNAPRYRLSRSTAPSNRRRRRARPRLAPPPAARRARPGSRQPPQVRMPQRESQLSAVRHSSPFPNGDCSARRPPISSRNDKLQRGSLRRFAGARAT